MHQAATTLTWKSEEEMGYCGKAWPTDMPPILNPGERPRSAKAKVLPAPESVEEEEEEELTDEDLVVPLVASGSVQEGLPPVRTPVSA